MKVIRFIPNVDIKFVEKFENTEKFSDINLNVDMYIYLYIKGGIKIVA